VKKFVTLAFVLVLLSTAVVVVYVRPVVAQVTNGTIYIKSDGSVEGTDKIQRDGNIYTFTDNIIDSIVVERSNIVVDGAGYMLEGTGSGTGIYLSGRSNVTIKNTEIKAFHTGIRLNESYDNTIYGNNITNNHYGILLWYSSNFNNISGNNVLNSYYGIELEDSSNNIISGNNVTANNGDGIHLTGPSNNNTISGNTVTNSDYGIRLVGPSNTTIIGNIITNNWCGIYLSSSNSVLRNNNMTNNGGNFAVEGFVLSHFVNDVDTSNTVDGKPVYYWINERDKTVPLDAGYVALVNCTNITIQNLNLTNNGQGVLLAYTTNTTITKNNITNNYAGIHLTGPSNNNTISGNTVTNSDYGIRLASLAGLSNTTIIGNNITNNRYGIHLRWSSNHNTISGNNITNNRCGIQLSSSSNYNSIYGNNITNNEDGIGIELVYSSNYNDIYGNNITNNGGGIYLRDSIKNNISKNNITNNGESICFWNSSSNKFYHNNFIGNTQQVLVVEFGDIPMSASTNFWDDGVSEGNYWSDYEDRYLNAEEIDESGIWNTPYVINENNQDNYPLISPWSKIPEEENPFWMQLWFWTIVVVLIVALAGAVYLLKKEKPPTPTAPTLPTEGTLEELLYRKEEFSKHQFIKQLSSFSNIVNICARIHKFICLLL
jgi:parallel beta-helix repeat protein